MENKRTAVTVYDVTYELANKTLAKNLNTMLKCIDGVNRKTWEYATAVYTIVDGELYTDDFKDLKAFAEAINVSPASLTKYVKACKFRMVNVPEYAKTLAAKNYEVNAEEFDKGFTVNKCYLLQALTDKELLTKFLEYLEEKGLLDTFYKLSERKFEELVKEFKDSLEPAKDEEPTEPESVEDKQDDEEVTDYADIFYQGFNYKVPMAVLEIYKVGDEQEVEG